MVFGFVLMIVLILLSKLLPNLKLEMLALVAGGVYLLIFGLIVVVLFTKGKKLFYKL